MYVYFKFSIVYLSQDIKIIHYMRYMYILFIEGFLVVSFIYICYQVYNTTRNIPIVDIFFFVIVIINFQSNKFVNLFY